MLKRFATTVLTIIIAGNLLMLAVILINRPPLTSPPGMVKRWYTYISTQYAETLLESPFPELRTPCLPGKVNDLLPVMEQHINTLGWRLVSTDIQNNTLTADAHTALYLPHRITIRLIPAGRCTIVKMLSQSFLLPIGLGGNHRHIQDLQQRIKPVAEKNSPTQPGK